MATTQFQSQVDQLLTQASNGYFPEGYVSEQALPMIGVVQTTGKLGSYGKNHLRIENSVKGGKGKYRRVETIIRSTQTYDIEGHGLEGIVTEEDYRNVLTPFDAENDESLGIQTMLWLEKEKTLADMLTSPSVMTLGTDVTAAQFDNYAASSPVDVIVAGKLAVRDASGGIVNTIIMDYKVAEKLKYHPQLLDALGYKFAKPGGLSYDELASALGVDRVLVPNVMYNSAQEGQTDVMAPVWGKHMVLAVLPTAAKVKQLSLGYLVKYSDKSPRTVYKWPSQNPPNATSMLVEDCYDMVLTDVNLGYLISNAIA